MTSLWCGTMVSKRLETTLYRKPTDAQNYLHHSSYHPNSTIKAIPLGQFIRLNKLCSTRKEFWIHSEQMIDAFLRRGYPEQDLLKARRESLTHVPAITTNRESIPFIVDYDPYIQPLKEIERYQNILRESTETKHLLDVRFITAYRRNTTLRNRRFYVNGVRHLSLQ